MRKILLAGALVVGLCPTAWAQNAVVQWKDSQTSPGSKAVTPSTPLPVAGTFSAGGFVPSLSYGTLTATATSSASTALPTNTGTVAFQNQTSVAVSCTLASGTATAATNELIVPAGSTIFVGTTGYNNAACINQTGSASNVIVLAGGIGLGTGFGGGSSSSGGTTNLTQISGNNVASGLTNGVLPVDVLTSSNNLYNAITAPVPCKAAATWNASTGLSGANPAGCDASAALWVDFGAINGVAMSTGAGVIGTGTQRVGVAQDTTTIAGSPAGTAGTPSTSVVSVQGVTSGTVIPVNTSQVNGVTMSTGAGATGTGTQRVGVAQDTTTIAGSAPGPAADTASVPVVLSPTSSSVSAMTHATTTSGLANNLIVKGSAGNLGGFNCTGISGGVAGYCIVVNQATVPSTGSLSASIVLDACYFDTTARGCSLSRMPDVVNYSAGITILVSSAASPYTYTTGTDTAMITADYK